MIGCDSHDDSDDFTFLVVTDGCAVIVAPPTLVSTWPWFPRVTTHTAPTPEPVPQLLRNTIWKGIRKYK